MSCCAENGDLRIEYMHELILGQKKPMPDFETHTTFVFHIFFLENITIHVKAFFFQAY